MNHPISDPYRTCEMGQCNHDLARAVTIVDLLGIDGPFPPNHMIVNLASARPALYDELERPLIAEDAALDAEIRRAV